MDPEYAPDRGLLRLTTAQIEALVRGDRAVLGDSDDAQTLRRIGVLDSRGVDPALAPMLETLRRPRARFGLRVERADRVARHRGWIARTGVVVLSGEVGPAEVQDVRLAPRPSSVARVLALLLDLDPRAPDPAEGPAGGPLPFDDLQDLVHGRRDWAAAADRVPRLLHLRWTRDANTPATTAMVLADLGAAGIVEARPLEDGRFLPVPRSTIEVWTGLTAMARQANAVSSSVAPPGAPSA